LTLASGLVTITYMQLHAVNAGTQLLP